jgi:hypothetical protein
MKRQTCGHCWALGFQPERPARRRNALCGASERRRVSAKGRTERTRSTTPSIPG